MNANVFTDERKTSQPSGYDIRFEFGNTLSMVYKKRRKIETSPFLSIFCWCYCSIYDVIASLLLNKALKIRLVVSYKGVSYKPYWVY